jgi:hypothetical protein
MPFYAHRQVNALRAVIPAILGGSPEQAGLKQELAASDHSSGKPSDEIRRIRANFSLAASLHRCARLHVFITYLAFFAWGSLGQLGRGFWRGFRPPQVFQGYLGQLGQICCIESKQIEETNISAHASSHSFGVMR